MDLATAVKELVENALDAGATQVGFSLILFVASLCVLRSKAREALDPKISQTSFVRCCLCVSYTLKPERPFSLSPCTIQWVGPDRRKGGRKGLPYTHAPPRHPLNHNPYTQVEVRLKDWGVESIEVSDNGSGVAPSNYQASKHKSSLPSPLPPLLTNHPAAIHTHTPHLTPPPPPHTHTPR